MGKPLTCGQLAGGRGRRRDPGALGRVLGAACRGACHGSSCQGSCLRLLSGVQTLQDSITSQGLSHTCGQLLEVLQPVHGQARVMSSLGRPAPEGCFPVAAFSAVGQPGETPSP